MEALSLSLLVGTLTVCLLLYKYFEHLDKKLPPGPRGIFAFLSVLKSLKGGSLHKQANIWREQYGELVLCRAVVADLCFLNSARLVRNAFNNRDLEYATSNRPRSFAGWFVYNNYRNIAISDADINPDWPKSRRMFHHAIKFYGDGVDRFESTVQAELCRLTSRIEACTGEEVEMDGLLRYSLLSIIHVLVTGECPEPESRTIEAIHRFDVAANLLFVPTTDMILTAFPFLRFVPGTPYREMCQNVSRGKERMLEDLFTKAKETHKPGQPRGIVDVLLDEQLKEENQWLTDDILKEIIVDVVSAAYNTSHGTLKALFLFLAHHPEVVSKIQKEIDDVMGQRKPRVADRSDLPYTEAVAMETIRLSSITPTGLPHHLTDDVTVDGFTIPKGTDVFSNIWTLNRDPEVFPDPGVFRPERFLDDITGELLPHTHPVRQSFLSFGIGRRSCPGENFARTRIFLYVTTLLQKFDILPPVKHKLQTPQPECYEQGLILRPKPFHLIFRQRH